VALDTKDKMIAALAAGFLLITAIAVTQSLVQFQRFGVRPVVYLTDFQVVYDPFCDGSIDVTFYLTNTGRAGFAQVVVTADEESLFTNNYRVASSESRVIVESVFIGDCVPHTFTAGVAATWL